MPPAPLIDPAAIDTSHVLVDREGIGRHNPQRFEMVQLTAIIYVDVENKLIIGYKDVGAGRVLGPRPYARLPAHARRAMCEAAAQLCSFFCGHIRLVKEGFVGFGGMEDVRFRGQVRPGDRLVLVSKATRLHRRQPMFECQGFVGTNMVFHAKIIGVNIPAQGEAAAPSERIAGNRGRHCRSRMPSILDRSDASDSSAPCHGLDPRSTSPAT